MSDPYIVWAVILLTAALVLFVAELLIPSAGVIAFVAATCLIAGIVMLFKVNTTVGLIGAIVTVLGSPFLFLLATKIWPNTPVGRLITLNESQARLTATGAHDQTPHSDSPAAGEEGVAVSDLRPVGTCVINGKRMDCLADGGVIRANTPVRVISNDGLQIKVRAREE